jgi:hypothetical protein
MTLLILSSLKSKFIINIYFLLIVFMNSRDIACLLIGISVAMWGISLITDPWA